jgi:hypothetical protein
MADIYNSYCVDDAANKVTKVADMVTIYIEEAHPADGWSLPNAITKISFGQPKTTEARLQVANTFVKDTHFDLPLYVDTIANEANDAYRAWPERLYVIQDGVVVYQGGPGPFGYRLDQVKAWLVARFGERTLAEPRQASYNPDGAVCRLKK